MSQVSVKLILNKAALLSVDKKIVRKTSGTAKAYRKLVKASMGTSGFPKIITGRLKRSIFYKKVNKYFYKVGTNVFYGPYLEFGTSRNAPFPFMRPNVRRLARRIKGVMAKVF